MPKPIPYDLVGATWRFCLRRRFKPFGFIVIYMLTMLVAAVVLSVPFTFLKRS